jgi:hypothetical protein
MVLIVAYMRFANKLIAEGREVPLL